MMANQFELYLEIMSVMRDGNYDEDDYPHIFSFSEQLHTHLYQHHEKNLLTLEHNKCDTHSYFGDNGGDCDCNSEDIFDPSGGSAASME
tara:strand:+ start:589 stop:855 length:267 start_codon:yes stop_codon:yes gene_type:complete